MKENGMAGWEVRDSCFDYERKAALGGTTFTFGIRAADEDRATFLQVGIDGTSIGFDALCGTVENAKRRTEAVINRFRQSDKASLKDLEKYLARLSAPQENQ